jgi:DNA-directed RNA polymerase specialized sigma subunit
MKTHLLSQLQSLRRAAADERDIISLPDAVRYDYQHLLEHEQNLADEMGRSPSDGEISDSSGLSPKRIAYIRQYRGAVSEGAAHQSRDGGQRDVASQAVNYDPAEAWTNFIYTDLSPTDQVILDLTLGRNGNPRIPTQEIAKRLGITSGAVSQRTAKIQKLLDAQHELGSIF